MSTTTQPLTEWEQELVVAEFVESLPNDEVPCSAPDCDRSASWALYPPCGHTVAGCSPCRAERDAWFAEHLGYTAYCPRCLANIPLPLDWRPL